LKRDGDGDLKCPMHAQEKFYKDYEHFRLHLTFVHGWQPEEELREIGYTKTQLEFIHKKLIKRRDVMRTILQEAVDDFEN
jgi:hypothetical protein